jgi:ADP-ribose 1''-phosphate phosphatase
MASTQHDMAQPDPSTLHTQLPIRSMSQFSTAAPKRQMEPDTDHLEAPAQKACKVGEGCDAATYSNFTERAREDPATVSAQMSYPTSKTAGSEETAPSTGMNAKGKTPATDDDQTNDNSTKYATKSTTPSPSPMPHDDLSSYKSTSLEDGAEFRGTVSGITEHVGDLFAAPDNTVLVHACNTQGSWGAGIALEFHERYPEAFKQYEQHCLVDYHPIKNPVVTGSCLLIPPSEDKPGAPKHWIACLFTSARYGKNKDSNEMILSATASAFRTMLEHLHLFDAAGKLPEITEIRMCRINAGLFNVKWKDTKKVLEGFVAAKSSGLGLHVYSLPAATSAPLRKGQTTLQSFIRRR